MFTDVAELLQNSDMFPFIPRDALVSGDERAMKQALQSVGPMIVGNIEVSMSLTKGRASLDRKAVAAAGIDLTPFEKVGAPVERLNVKRVN